MKVKVLIGILCIGLITVLFIAFKPSSFEEEMIEKLENLDTYILEGTMEVVKGEETRSYGLSVAYQKAENSYFKVVLNDKELNQEQIILRNDEGVYVVTPSLNQIFKFEGDWPMNTPKPYLLQTISSIMQQDDAVLKKEKEGYLLEANVSYPGNESFHHEQIYFDKDGKLEWLQIYNEDHVVQVKIVFSKVEYNVTIDKDYFVTPTVLESKVAAQTIQEEDLPLYPVNVFSSQLTNVTSMQVNGKTKYILEYKGDKNFTVVQTVTKEEETTKTVIMPGEMIDVLDIVGFYDGNHLHAVYQQIEFGVYSDDLAPEEMMKVIQSMQVAVMK